MAAAANQYTPVTRLTRRGDRRQFISDLAAAIRPLGLVRELEVVQRDDNTCLTVFGTGLSAQVWFAHGRKQGVPLISWHDAIFPLAGFVPGAWSDINRFHRRKATSFPESLDELISKLVLGLMAARDGTAFLEPVAALDAALDDRDAPALAT